MKLIAVYTCWRYESVRINLMSYIGVSSSDMYFILMLLLSGEGEEGGGGRGGGR